MSGDSDRQGWPSEWGSHRHAAHEPAHLVDLDLEDTHVHAVRLSIRPTHSIRSVVITLLGVLFGVLSVGSIVLTVNEPTSDAVAGSIVLVVFAAAFLFSGLAAIVMARRGLGVDLTPDTLTVGLGGRRTSLQWNDVASIAAVSDSGTDAIAITRRDDTVVQVPCRRLKSDPHLALEALRFYAEHPSNREELTGDAAVQRIAARSFA